MPTSNINRLVATQRPLLHAIDSKISDKYKGMYRPCDFKLLDAKANEAEKQPLKVKTNPDA